VQLRGAGTTPPRPPASASSRITWTTRCRAAEKEARKLLREMQEGRQTAFDKKVHGRAPG
jgi:hypothetical protein